MLEAWEDMTEAERRNLVWGMRDASEPHMNRVRREGFEAVKGAITDKELPPSKIIPPPGVIRLPVRVAG